MSILMMKGKIIGNDKESNEARAKLELGNVSKKDESLVKTTKEKKTKTKKTTKKGVE